MQLKICSVNILNDILSKKGITPYQKDRINILVDDILKLCEGSPDILYICEATSNKNIENIAELLDLKIVDNPYKYSKNDIMAFLVNSKKINTASVEHITYTGAASKNGFIRLEFKNIQIFGVHYPYRAFKDMYYRHLFSRIITSKSKNRDTIAMGDFNSLSFMASQLQLLKSGLNRARFNKPARTPNPHLHGKTAPHYVPRAVIDYIYYSKNIELKKSSWAYSDATDHPILFTNLSVKI